VISESYCIVLRVVDCTGGTPVQSLISRAAISKNGVFTTIDTEETMPLCIDLEFHC